MSFRICALDDDESTLYTLEAMTGTQNWNFRGTVNAEECLGWVAEGDVDILLLDYHMPMMNGLDVLQRVKSLSAAVTVLMLTIEQDPLTAEQLLMAGAEDFINKPVRLADFISRIRLHQRLQEQERAGRPETRKGITASKLQRIVDFLKGEAGGVEIDALSEGCGIAYTTAHRYLDHLVKTGLVVTRETQQDGKPGRPSRLYRFVGLKSGRQ